MQFPIKVLKRLAAADIEVECPTVEKVVTVVRLLNEFEFTQEPLAQIQLSGSFVDNLEINNLENALLEITQEPLTQLEQLFKTSPIASINWAAHVVLMNSKLKLGLRYWYMKQTLECGWSSNILDIHIKLHAYVVIELNAIFTNVINDGTVSYV